MIHGLPDDAVAKIREVLATCPEVEKAVLYGSRAKGNHRNGSDIDLTLVGPRLTHRHLLRLGGDLDDLLLPWSIDLSLLGEIRNPDLLEHIERVGLDFYARSEAS